MKYCVDFKKDFKYLNEIDELTINYRPEDKTLIDFLLLYKNKRININIEKPEEFLSKNCIKDFDMIKKAYPDIDFAFKIPYNTELIEKINGYKFFFKDFVNDLDILNACIKYEVSDIYIVENLGFELLTIGNFLHKNNIRVRVFPNVAQSKCSKTPALKKFFIRPEDINIYEPYVDVMEFFEKPEPESIETYYKIYAIDKKWFGKLNELILSFDSKEEIDSRHILPSFAKYRLNCGKRCFKTGNCNICYAIKNLAQTLEKEHIIIKSDV